MVELRPSSSLSTGCVVSLREDWAIFCHAGSGRVGRVRSAGEKSLEILRRGWELNPDHGEHRQWAIPLSYHDWLAIKLGSVYPQTRAASFFSAKILKAKYGPQISPCSSHYIGVLRELLVIQALLSLRLVLGRWELRSMRGAHIQSESKIFRSWAKHSSHWTTPHIMP